MKTPRGKRGASILALKAGAEEAAPVDRMDLM